MNGGRRKALDLDKALAELETIVEQLEAGEQPLDKSLKDFERGIRLSRECQGALKDAEQRVQLLLGSDLQDLDADSGDEAEGPDPTGDRG